MIKSSTLSARHPHPSPKSPSNLTLSSHHPPQSLPRSALELKHDPRSSRWLSSGSPEGRVVEQAILTQPGMACQPLSVSPH